jgi:gliding motility-associated-like protein
MKTYLIFISILFLNLIASTAILAQPVIITQPQNSTVCAGSSTSFFIVASNALTYQWQEHDGIGWYDIDESITYTSGEKTPNLSIIDAASALNNYQYRCIASNTNGSSTSNAATLIINPTPVIISNPQNTTVCRNETASFVVEATLTNTYQWYENDGTDWQPLDNNAFYQGVNSDTLFIYTITGMDTFEYKCILTYSVCTTESNSATLYVNATPTAYNITGGGEYCESDNGVEIGLSNSQIGIDYELFNNSITVGIVISGTGSSLSFGYLTDEGTYTATAIDGSTGCTNQMNGSALVIANPLPNNYAITGGGEHCFGSIGSPIGLSNSQANVNYELYNNDVSTGIVMDGTGNALDFGLFTDEGIYTIIGTNPSTTCSKQMDGTAEIISNPLPSIFITTGGGSYCEGDLGIEIGLSGSELGISYQIFINFTPTAFVEEGTGLTLNFGFFTEAGQYSIIATNNSTTCTNPMSDTTEISINLLPQRYTIMGGGQYCENGNGVEIGLSGSELNIDYELYNNDEATGTVLNGTGEPLNFGYILQEGIYTIIAHNVLTYCEKEMIGSTQIIINDLPIANAGDDISISYLTSTSLNGNASGGSGNYLFSWTPTNLLINANTQNPTTTELTTSTLFFLTVTDEITGCISNNDTVLVTVTGGALQVIAYSSIDTICKQSSANLFALANGGTGEYEYTWSSNPAGFSSNIINPTVSPIQTTTYYIEVTNSDLTAYDSIIVYVHTSPIEVEVIGGGGYCMGDIGVEIGIANSEPDIVYTLYFENVATFDTIIGTSSDIFFNYQTNAGVYTILATNKQTNCSLILNEFVIVYIFETPEIYKVTGDSIFCEGSNGVSIYLDLSQIGVSYELFINNVATGIIKSGNGSKLTFNNQTQGGSYSIIATSLPNLCSIIMDGKIEVITRPSPKIDASNDTTICSGTTIDISAISSESNYLWDTNPVLYTDTIYISPLENTIYTVYTHNNYGCSDSSIVNVFVNQTPDIMANHNCNTNSIVVEPTTLHNYEFSFNNNIIQSGESNEYFLPVTTCKGDTIQVVGSTLSGCFASNFVVIEYINNVNAFTPDGDGINDIFMQGCDIKVFNRWGEELYNGSSGWDGQYNGEYVVPSTYYFVNSIKDIEGNIINVFKGSVTVVKQ